MAETWKLTNDKALATVEKKIERKLEEAGCRSILPPPVFRVS